MKKQEPELFPEFWEIWRKQARHTDGRGLARETFAKHVKNGADPRDIVDGAKAFFRTMKDRDREYVPLSATWINRESYGDLAEMQRAFDAKMAERQTRRDEPAQNVVQMPASQSISPERRAEMAARARDLLKGAGQ
jgi:hypothetical protein